MKTYTITLFLTLFSLVSQAQEFELDSTFGEGGIVITKTDFTSEIFDVAQGPDGRIYAVGYSTVLRNQISAYLPSGDLDSTFGVDGIVNDNSFSQAFPLSVLVQTDGKLLVLYGKFIIRYHPNGAYDTTFGSGGAFEIKNEGALPSSLASFLLLDNGKIVAAGQDNGKFLILRLNSDGSLDDSFGKNGEVLTAFEEDASIASMSLKDDGEIVAVGTTGQHPRFSFALAKYSSNGELDNEFGTDGKVVTKFSATSPGSYFASHVAIQNDKILVAGVSNSSLGMARYNNNGSLDSTFAQNGLFSNGTYSSPTGMVILPNNKIIISGNREVSPDNFAYRLLRFQENGRIDSSFGNAGQLLLDITNDNDYTQCLTLVSNNELIVAGGSSTAQNDSSSLASAHFTLVKYKFDAINSVTDQETIEPWIIFPNPSSTYFSLVSKQSLSNATHIELLNRTGKVVLEQAIEGREMKIDVRQLPAGLYLYRIHTKQRMLQSGKVVKQ